MNNLTRVLKVKGYNLTEANKALGISLATFRRYEKESHLHHDDLIKWIDELPNKNEIEG